MWIAGGSLILSSKHLGEPSESLVLMKWFKHLTNARRDPKIIALKAQFGHQGVGRWWEIVEIIAEEMNDSDRCEITINGPFLSKHLGFRSTNGGRSFVQWLATSRLLVADLTTNDWRLRCPKLLELRDHRIKNQNKKAHQNRTEVEVEKNTLIQELFTPVDNPVKFPFEDFWIKYPKRNGIKTGKAAAEKEWKKLRPDEQQKAHEAIGPQIAHYDACKKANVFVAEFADCHRWLRNRKFNDEVSKNVLNSPQKAIDPWVKDWIKVEYELRNGAESANLAGFSEAGSKALLKIGGFERLKKVHPDHMHFVKEDFKNAWLAK